MSLLRAFSSKLAAGTRITRNTTPAISRRLRAIHPRTFTSSPTRQLFQTPTRLFQHNAPRTAQIIIGPGRPEGPKPPHRPGISNRGYQIITVVIVLGTTYYVSHLEQVPYTGRWRFMNTDASEEQELADMLHEDLLRQYEGKILPSNHPITRHVRRVVSRILVYSKLGVLKEDKKPSIFPFDFGFGGDSTFDMDVGASDKPAYGPEKEWNVLVVNDKTNINAMAIPGTVVVFTGILPVCQDEQGLAAVLAHEIGHVVARHTAERMSSATIAMLLLPIAWLLTGLDLSIISLGHNLLLSLPNSRAQEKEADHIGLRLMSRACYDPRAAPEMFTRLGIIESKMSSGMDLAFLHTHPSSEARVKFLERHLKEAYEIMASNPECASLLEQYQSFKDSAKRIRFDQSGNWEVL